MEVERKEDIATICKKHNILLTKNKANNIFTIKFNSKNENIDLPSILNFKLFDLLGKLNKDILDRLEIVKENNEDNVEVLFCFTQFGKELGIPLKYMYCDTHKRIEDKRIIFYSSSIPYDKTLLGKRYSEVTSEFSDLYIDIINPHEIDITYVFQIDLHENLPIYMENIIGLMMKKTFYRLKGFIENLK